MIIALISPSMASCDTTNVRLAGVDAQHHAAHRVALVLRVQADGAYAAHQRHDHEHTQPAQASIAHSPSPRCAAGLQPRLS